MAIKYITVLINEGLGEQETIVVFPDFVEHRSMAMKIVGDMDKVVAGGFVTEDMSECFGESHSLGLKTREFEDTMLLRMMVRADW